MTVMRCQDCKTPIMQHTARFLTLPQAARIMSAAIGSHADGCEAGALKDIAEIWNRPLPRVRNRT